MYVCMYVCMYVYIYIYIYVYIYIYIYIYIYTWKQVGTITTKAQRQGRSGDSKKKWCVLMLFTACMTFV